MNSNRRQYGCELYYIKRSLRAGRVQISWQKISRAGATADSRQAELSASAHIPQRARAACASKPDAVGEPILG